MRFINLGNLIENLMPKENKPLGTNTAIFITCGQ